MSISKKTLQEAHIALLTNGQIALCDTDKKGILRVHRAISRSECVNLIKTLYIKYCNDHKGAQVMLLPFGENTSLAIAAIDKPAESSGVHDQPQG